MIIQDKNVVTKQQQQKNTKVLIIEIRGLLRSPKSVPLVLFQIQFVKLVQKFQNPFRVGLLPALQLWVNAGVELWRRQKKKKEKSHYETLID